jgi:hydroxymethylbilane synthase
LRWTPPAPLAPATGPVRAWDGSRAERVAVEPLPSGIALCRQHLPGSRALFIAHGRALPPEAAALINAAAHLWVPGLSTWQGLAERGLWVEGCAEGLGFAQLEPLLREPLLQLPALSQWTVLTHEDAASGWNARHVIGTYRMPATVDEHTAGAPAESNHVFWHSSAQFERCRGSVADLAQHACGPGKTYQHLLRAGVQNLRMFPSVAHWRSWLGV